MLQYILTALAGIAIGIVGMRLFQPRPGAQAAPAAETADEAPQAVEAAAPEPAGGVNRKLLAGAGAMALVAVAVIALKPAAPDDDAALTASAGAAGAGAMPGAAGAKPLDDVDTMISRLAKRLETDTTDGDGFRMLGWSYVMTGHPDKALEPYKRAAALLPKNALVHSGYGEALVGVAGNKVTDEAKRHFDQALAIDPTEPRARFFAALWQAQHGQEREALDKWLVLANAGPAEAQWQPMLRKQIDETARKLGVDVSARLKQSAPAAASAGAGGPDAAAVQAAGALPPADRAAMIDGMVEGLAAKLKANPGDADGWVKLLRSRMVLGQGAKAGEDLLIARKALAGNAAGLARVNAAAIENKVPGAR